MPGSEINIAPAIDSEGLRRDSQKLVPGQTEFPLALTCYII